MLMRHNLDMSQNLIRFEGSSGHLAGVLHVPSDCSYQITVLVHGYGSSKDGSTCRELAQLIEDNGQAAFRFDLSGCGESAGQFANQTISNWRSDLNAAIECVCTLGYGTINLFGSSAGGLVCLAAALDNSRVRRIALKAPVSDYPGKRRKELGSAGIREWKQLGFTYWQRGDGTSHRVNYSFYEDSIQHVMRERASKVKCPVLIVHGNKDMNTMLSQSLRLVSFLPQGRLLILHNGDHDLSVNGDHSLSNSIFANWLQ